MEGQEAQVPYAGLLHRLATNSNSNEERLKLLERRMTGELPSPRSLSFEAQQLKRSPDENSRAPAIVPYSGVSDSEGSDSTSETEPSNKRPRLSSSPHKQNKAHLGRSASPFQQVTNHPRRQGSSTVKREKQPKHAPPPPGGTPPPSSKPHKTNTINKYFSHREDNARERLPLVSTETQTDVSFQQQQAAMQSEVQHAQSVADQGRSGFHEAGCSAYPVFLTLLQSRSTFTVCQQFIVIGTGKQWQICSKGCRTLNRLQSACRIRSVLHSSSCKMLGLTTSFGSQPLAFSCMAGVMITLSVHTCVACCLH